MKLILFRVVKLTILFFITTLLLNVIPYRPLDCNDSLHVTIAITTLYSLFEILSPSYTIVLSRESPRKVVKIM